MYVGSIQLVAPQLAPSAADFLLRDGTRALTANWDAGSFEIRAQTFESDVATGTAPLVVASTTKVTNLNADLLDGLEAAAFATAVHVHTATDITSGVLTHERGGLEFDASAITTGGLIRGASAGVMSILAAGTDGQVLTMQADSSVAWEDAVGGAIDAIELKASVKAATTANITLSGEQTIDGVTCVSGDRVLVKNQATASQNGIYIVDDYGWTRASDYAAAAFAAATFGHIQQGTANGDKKWLCTNNTGNDTIGTHNLVFTLGAGSGLTGPGSSTDNAIIRWDGTGGATLQNSSAIVDDSGKITTPASGSGGGYGFAGSSSVVQLVASDQVQILSSASAQSCSVNVGNAGMNIGGCLTQTVATTTGNVNWEASNFVHLAISANISPTFTAPCAVSGESTLPCGLLILRVTQDATGSRTITWPATVFWPGGTPPTLSTAANAVDVFGFYWDGANYHGFTLSLNSQV